MREIQKDVEMNESGSVKSWRKQKRGRGKDQSRRRGEGEQSYVGKAVRWKTTRISFRG